MVEQQHDVLHWKKVQNKVIQYQPIYLLLYFSQFFSKMLENKTIEGVNIFNHTLLFTVYADDTFM